MFVSYDRQDHYYRKAKQEGYRARSAFKLKQIQKKFRVIYRGNVVLDLGAAPGGWTQVASEYVGNKGKVIALDISPIRRFEKDNIITIQMDMRAPKLLPYLETIIKHPVNVILSDLAGNTSGNWSLDTERQLFLASMAFETAEKYLHTRGNFVTKVFRGSGLKEFEDLIKGRFSKIKHWRPPATRKQSAEEYIVCKEFLGTIDDE